MYYNIGMIIGGCVDDTNAEHINQQNDNAHTIDNEEAFESSYT